MNIGADLVVLSACNTGIGKLQRGEGVSSLARGFAYAGCPSILYTNWAVTDKATSEIVALFHQKLKNGLSKSKALQQAKIEYMSKSSKNTIHPYYWGGINLVGNQQSITFNSTPFYWKLLLGILGLLSIFGLIFFKQKK